MASPGNCDKKLQNGPISIYPYPSDFELITIIYGDSKLFKGLVFGFVARNLMLHVCAGWFCSRLLENKVIATNKIKSSLPLTVRKPYNGILKDEKVSFLFLKILPFDCNWQ